MRATEQFATNGENRFATAGEWLLRLQADDIAQDEFSAWLQWYEADPLNRAAFEEAQATFEAARGLSAEERSQWARELLGRRQEESAVQRTTAPEQSSIKSRALSWTRSWPWNPRRATGFAAATMIGLSLGLAMWLLPLRGPQPAPLTATFETPLATHRTETLPDGSVVKLGARSSISLSFSAETRYLVLEGGEAFFTVAKDSARPFVVQAGPVRVRAVGTEFNVRRAAESTTVAVSEGVVEVTQDARGSRAAKRLSSGRGAGESHQVRLNAGEQIVIDGPSITVAVKSVDPVSVSAWQTGRLEFVNEPLRVVVATINRYSPREIVVTDQSLSDLRITGTVSSEHTEEWLRALPEIIPVRVIEVSKETVLVSPAAGS